MSDVRVRAASADDMEALVQFELDIAAVSFGDRAVEDPDVYRSRLRTALRDRESIALVAVRSAPRGEEVVGWAWVTPRRNALTNELYANFRSLAVRPDANTDDGAVGEVLMEAVLAAIEAAGLGEIVGRVHVSNVPMRALYAKFGFVPEQLTMHRGRETTTPHS